MNKISNFVRNNQIGMALVITLVLFIINIAMNPKSLNVNTFGSIIALTLILAFSAAGQTLVIISGGIDLSIGATMSFAAIMTVNIMRGQEGMIPQVIMQVIPVVIIIGIVNAFGIVKLKLPALIITLCVANVVTRLQYVYTSGLPQGMAAPSFTSSLQYRFFGVIPGMAIYGIIFFALVFYILNRSIYGQQLFLVGNNKNAAYLAGIKSERVEMLSYVIASFLAGIAGIISAGYFKYVICQSFDTYTMLSIVAVVVGGTLLVGGKGSYIGSVVGALLLVVLSNCLSVFQSSDSVRSIIMGVVLLVLLAVYNKEKPIRQ